MRSEIEDRFPHRVYRRGVLGEKLLRARRVRVRVPARGGKLWRTDKKSVAVGESGAFLARVYFRFEPVLPFGGNGTGFVVDLYNHQRGDLFHRVLRGEIVPARARLGDTHADDHARRAHRRYRKSAQTAQMGALSRSRTRAHHVDRAPFYPYSDGRNGTDNERAESARRGFRNGRAYQTGQGDRTHSDPFAHQRVPPCGRTGRRDGRAVLFGQ